MVGYFPLLRVFFVKQQRFVNAGGNVRLIVRGGLTLVSMYLTALIGRDIKRTLNIPSFGPTTHIDHAEVSVLVPARNEAHRIGRLLEGLHHQQSRSFHVIVLDDHSDDGTGDVVRAWQPRLADVRMVEGAALPAGWSGKCWACWQASRESTAPWLLFLDADTAPQPGLIAALVARAEERCLDLLTIIPLVETKTFWECVLIPPFGALIQIVFPPTSVNDPQSRIAMANGPCILVRRDVYEATGGHAAVRASILEDVDLGQLIKHAGYRIELATGPDLLHVRLYTRFAEISEGLQKNAWAGYAAGGWRSAFGGFRQLFLSVVPLALVAVGVSKRQTDAGRRFLGHGIYGVCLTVGFWAWYVRRFHRISPLWGACFPFGVLAYFALAGRAWLKIWHGEGVTWKGRAYGVTSLS
jgi:chlorobactene glucosyltransferase